MNISNENTPKLPNELQKAIDNAKNVLTITEQETKRLNILAKDQESIIRGLLDRKAAADEEAKIAEGELKQLKDKVKVLENDIKEKTESLKDLNTQIIASKTMLDGVNEAKEKVRDILKSLE